MNPIASVIAASMVFTAVASPSQAAPAPTFDPILAVADQSQCRLVNWGADRGSAPRAYIRGMALVYARALCEPDRADVKIASEARGATGGPADRKDALTWYDSMMTGQGMPNTTAGTPTLRHAYNLMIGLGMRESSGQHCVGRDLSANFTSADSAEAGLFQTSWGIRSADPSLPAMTAAYGASNARCLSAVFSKNVQCKPADAKTWGEGPGAQWQILTKACPAFAAEYASVVLRRSGGSKGEFGPIRNRKAQVRVECDAMLKSVEAAVASQPGVCAALR